MGICIVGGGKLTSQKAYNGAGWELVVRAPLAVYNALPVPVSLMLKCSLRASRTAVKCAPRLAVASALALHSCTEYSKRNTARQSVLRSQ